MALVRSMLLAASQNTWLREHAVHYPFVRQSVSRFMPGETLQAAISAAEILQQKNIAAIFTHLGENISDPEEARQVAEHYLDVLDKIHQHNLHAEISIKLTQLGLDLSPDLCFDHLVQILQRENPDSIVWIDMEASNYVAATLDLYKRVLKKFPNVGICLQAYLFRTKRDLADLLPLKPAVRLVKGAYKEPADIAFPHKATVDENYFSLAQDLLRAQAAGHCLRATFGTHDLDLIHRLESFVAVQNYSQSALEIQMLYGIQRAEQQRLAQSGARSAVLVAYGTYWYPWFVRRLAERPANLWFMLRNVFAS
jgi:proline dehydrogenase